MVLTGVPASQSSRTHSALPSSAAAASALAAIASLAAGERMETISASPRAQARQRMWPSSSRAPAATSFLAIHGSERSHAYESSTLGWPVDVSSMRLTMSSHVRLEARVTKLVA
eukprot:5803577-Prymnesium_polylepis.1